MAATRACSRASVSECAFCTHAPAIITISACVLRTRDYYFSGEPASFPLPLPILYIEKRQGSIVSEFLKILFEQVCKRFVGNILDAFFVYNAVVPQSRESPTRFSKKQKQEGKKKISKKAFTSRPMNRRNFSSRGLLVSILLNSRPWKRWCASLKLGIWIKIIKGIVYFD